MARVSAGPDAAAEDAVMIRTPSLSLVLLGLLASPSWASADPLTCDLRAYKPVDGLSATVADNALTLLWDGEAGQQLRLVFTLVNQTPTIRELAVRKKGGDWGTLAANATPDIRVVSGLRRMSNQQMVPLRGLGVPLTNEIVDRFRWEPFWDAPLDAGDPKGPSGNPPPASGVANQPGLPRQADEIKRAKAVYKTSSCEVKSTGARLDVIFPGVELGVFSGSLQYSVFKQSGLIQQDVVATTQAPWVAYKYDMGLKGLTSGAGTRVAWRDIGGTWQDYRFAGAANDADVPVTAANRVIVADRGASGALSMFPPPHTFFWAREIAINLGYTYYRKDADGTFSFGIRQAEKEHESENPANFALYSARPGSTQHMTGFIFATTGGAPVAMEGALAFTHGDRFKPLPGYQVMGHHFHMDLGSRLLENGLDAEIPDLAALKATGLNIVSQVDSVFGGAGDPTPDGAQFLTGPKISSATRPAEAPGGGGRRRGDPLAIRYAAIEGAKRHSDTGFLVMPSQEYYGSPLGGHTDLIFSNGSYWVSGRNANEPLVEKHEKYGSIYHLGSAEDLMEMARREKMLINMPHPRTKGSTGYPDAVKDLPFFSDPQYQGMGFRWGMGLDRSERRLCEYRCLPLFDDMTNWVVDSPIPLKYFLAISEVRHMQPGDDVYASAPVSYVKFDGPVQPADSAKVVATLMKGDYFVSSGEVLIANWSLQGSGKARTVSAELEWTFPLEIVEVVWGDGKTSNRKVVAATDVAPMGKKRFEIPVDLSGAKWVRVAAWDSAGNGALTQPMRLAEPAGSARGRQ